MQFKKYMKNKTDWEEDCKKQRLAQQCILHRERTSQQNKQQQKERKQIYNEILCRSLINNLVDHTASVKKSWSTIHKNKTFIQQIYFSIAAANSDPGDAVSHSWRFTPIHRAWTWTKRKDCILAVLHSSCKILCLGKRLSSIQRKDRKGNTKCGTDKAQKDEWFLGGKLRPARIE